MNTKDAIVKISYLFLFCEHRVREIFSSLHRNHERNLWELSKIFVDHLIGFKFAKT